MLAHKSKFIKSFVKFLSVFIVVLIVLESFLSDYFITYISERIEKNRKQELVHSWDSFYQQVYREFNLAIHGYAWWSELGEAYKRGDDSTIINYFVADNYFSRDFDLFVSASSQNEFIFGIYNGKHIYKNSPEFDQLITPFTLNSFYKFAQLDYELGVSQKTVSDTIHSYLGYFKGIPMVMAISPACNNDGRPLSRGYLVFGINLQSMIKKAEAIIPAKISFSTRPFKNAYAQSVIKSERQGQSFYLSINPYYKAYPVLKEATYFFILLQICFVSLLFAIILPIFTRRHTKYLDQVITERTAQIREINDDLISSNAELLSALANIRTLSGFLPICASCKKIRNDQGYWSQVESFIQENSEVVFSHSLCPQCVEKLYPEIADRVLSKQHVDQ